MFGHDVLGFPRTPSSSERALVAQAKACGYILSMYPRNNKCKIPADTTVQNYIVVIRSEAKNLVFLGS